MGDQGGAATNTRGAEAHLELVGRLEGALSGGAFVGSFKIAADPTELGEYEYVAVARIPECDVAKASSPLPVRIEGERVVIRVDVDAAAPASFDDLVILEGEGYERALKVREGRPEGRRTALVFEGVRIGVKYTCTIDPGREGAPYTLFADYELKASDVLPREGAGAAR